MNKVFLLAVCCLFLIGCGGYMPTGFPGMFGSYSRPNYNQPNPYSGYGANQNSTFWQESNAQDEINDRAMRRIDEAIERTRAQRRNTSW